MAMADSLELSLSYGVPRWNPAWAVPDVPVPEAPSHDAAIDYLKALLTAWAMRMEGDHRVFRNLGLRWVPEEPRSGFDPDLCLVAGASELPDRARSLRLWLPGHSTPRLAIEVVSAGHPYKDYVDTPERAAAAGVPELWVYDPELLGPKARGGPFLLQIWESTQQGFVRTHAGQGPAYSSQLSAWLHPNRYAGPGSARLRISSNAEAGSFWLTPLERETQRADEQAQRADEQARRADELEQALANLRSERPGDED